MKSRRAARGQVVGVAMVAVLLASTSCASGPRDPQEAASTTLIVFAASSLTDVLEVLADDFERSHPGVTIVASYGGSTDLTAQIAEGAPADAFLSADPRRVSELGSLASGSPLVFATNWLTIAVPPENPAGISGIADFGRDDVETVVCAPHVPCGAVSLSLAESLGVTLRPASEENAVSDVLGKVASGHADAGLVYTTDIARAKTVEEVPIPGADAFITTYVATTLSPSSSPELSAAFVAYLTSEEARTILASAGFGAP